MANAKKPDNGGKKEPGEAGGFAKSFDQYEYVAVITPGAALLLGLILALPRQIPWSDLKDAGLAGFGVFLVAAYVAGHILRAIGDVFERLFWMLFRGMPSEWVLHADPLKRGLLDAQQQKDLVARTTDFGKFENYKLKDGDGFWLRSAKFEKWQAVTRRIYLKVRAANNNARVDAFNRTYGMMVGITVALLIVSGLLLLRHSYYEAAIAFVLALFCVYRMYVFGKLYARELYVSFLEVAK